MVITAPVRTQVFLLYCDKSQTCILESRAPQTSQRDAKRMFFLEVRPAEASVETPAARIRAKLPSNSAQNPSLRRQLEDDRSSVRRRVSLKEPKSQSRPAISRHRKPPESHTVCACVTDPSSADCHRSDQSAARGRKVATATFLRSQRWPQSLREKFSSQTALYSLRGRGRACAGGPRPPCAVAATDAHTQMQRDAAREKLTAPLCHAAR